MIVDKNLDLQNKAYRAMVTTDDIGENVGIMNSILQGFWHKEVVEPPSCSMANERVSLLKFYRWMFL